MATSAKVRLRSARDDRNAVVERSRIVRRRCWSRYTSTKRRNDRRGIATVEFAIVAPLLLMIVFGIIEFGRMVMVQQIMTNASREGARRAIIEDATSAEVVSLVSDYLADASVSGATVTIEPLDLSNVGFGDPVTVAVDVAFEDVSWAGSSWFLGGATFHASTVMQGERMQ